MSVMFWMLILSLGQFHSDSPDVMVSESRLSGEDPTLCLVSVYSNFIQSMEKVSPLANITIYTHLSSQTHVIRVTILKDSQTDTG